MVYAMVKNVEVSSAKAAYANACYNAYNAYEQACATTDGAARAEAEATYHTAIDVANAVYDKTVLDEDASDFESIADYYAASVAVYDADNAQTYDNAKTVLDEDASDFESIADYYAASVAVYDADNAQTYDNAKAVLDEAYDVADEAYLASYAMVKNVEVSSAKTVYDNATVAFNNTLAVALAAFYTAIDEAYEIARPVNIEVNAVYDIALAEASYDKAVAKATSDYNLVNIDASAVYAKAIAKAKALAALDVAETTYKAAEIVRDNALAALAAFEE